VCSCLLPRPAVLAGEDRRDAGRARAPSRGPCWPRPRGRWQRLLVGSAIRTRSGAAGRRRICSMNSPNIRGASLPVSTSVLPVSPGGKLSNALQAASTTRPTRAAPSRMSSWTSAPPVSAQRSVRPTVATIARNRLTITVAKSFDETHRYLVDHAITVGPRPCEVRAHRAMCGRFRGRLLAPSD
jgi:hypothetical protein